MKKTYLLIVDIFLIINKIFLLKGLTSFVIKPSGISTKGGEFVSIKKPVFSKLILVLLTGLIGLSSYAQTYKAFSIREKIDIRGKMIVAGNNILGKDNSPCNDNSLANQSVSMQYIDIDGDASTFSSSSADLSVPTQANGSATTCYRVSYAALYWGAMLQSGSRTDINKVKLKLPGATTYNDINGEVIYDAIASPIIPDANTPYACYADVTSLLAGLTSLTGTYTVANVISSIGTNSTTGLSAGWTLFVVYEDPNLQMKSFNVFDGFSHIYSSHTETIPVSGFITPPSGVVDIQFAYAALDGDKPQGGTKLEFENRQVTTPLRSSNKFFNSTIENTNGVSTTRNPSGSNTLGYDTGVLEVAGANPSYINNNQTSTTFTLQVAGGQADPIFYFFSAYAVDIIAPKIDLTKLVKNTSGVDVGGGNVTLGQSLTYEISYQSVGNDNVTNFTIKDVLPINITFDPTTSIDYTNAGGATLQSYDPLTRTIIFSIPNTSVEVNDGTYTIRINVKVVPDCNSLTTACSNEIKNQAFATYQGVINTNVFQEEGSFASTACKLGSPESTNFLVDISNCKFTQDVILCGSSVVLEASDGYSTYSWSRNLDGSSPIGTGQTFTATQIGIYYVHNTAPSTCKDIVEEITVKYFGVTNTNPVIPYAQLPYLGEVVTCPDDGKQLPNLFLCGANDSRVIQTGISDAASIEWYKLNEGSCVAVVNSDCANENSSCTWALVGTGPDFTANTSGQFRLTIRYPGGCFSQFYFNVYQNLLDPTATSKDILCTTNGEITVGGVPSGYEYSLNAAGPYQSSNVFPNASFPVINAGSYTVYIKQVGVTANPCIFTVPDILIRQRDFTVSTFLTQPLCQGDKGAIKLVANDALPQYYFSISQGATLVNSVGPITANEYEFSNLNPGVYTTRVWTDDGCDYSNSVEIIDPVLLTATAAITKPLTCTDGEITVYPVGGTPPFIYYVNSTTVFQSTPEIAVTNPLPAGGIYNIVIEDSNNCTTNTSITVAAIPPPVYTMSQTDVECYNDNVGVINFNVTNANGYTLAYSIDNGVTYLPTPTFSNLFAGAYNTIVRYTLGTSVCYGTMQVITITQPSTALTASAGVSELAGCGPSGEGKVRITNPQGGTPFPAPDYYLYSFDNQATWVTTNEAYLAPGTYTLYIKDAVGCIFPMPNITIAPEPVAPTIDVAAPVFNCDGTANSTVTVTNSGSASFEYDYLLDGNANTNVPSNVFVNVPSGSHTVSVTYKLLTVPTYSNLLKEDFGSGSDAQSPGINPAFCWERQVEATKCNGDKLFGNGEYTVTKSLENNPYSGWHNPVDHTAGSATGRYLAVDAGTAIPNNAVLYRKTINDIIPDQPIYVRFFATNLLKIGNTQPDASLTVELQNSSGTPLSSSSTGGIPKTNGWVQYDRTINPGNNTTLDFVLRLEIAQVNGIDFAVDDIEVYQLPKICVTKVDFPFIVPTGKAFDASITGFKNVSCSGANDGEITIAAQNFDATNGFQYSINNGTTWNTQLTSPYTITGLANGTYDVQIRYDATGTCVKTISQIITAPTPLTVTASITTLATCSTGATITAIGAGGTLAYQYELRDAAGVVVIRPYQLNAQFTDVSIGNYTVFVKDANLCVSAVGAAINVVAPPTLTATLDAGSDICFDSVNQASLIVNASGGTPPFTYSLNGAAAQNSNTFTNVGTGTHDILVTDSYNCTAAISGIVIAPQLTAVANTTKTLDCTTSPDAVITATISGGTAPFTVTVLSGTGPGTIAQPTATTFTYTTAVASTYQFQIQDANNCITTATSTINPLVPITATTTNVDPSCNGVSDGSVQIIPSGGVGPYTYSSDGTTYVPGSLFSGLADGTYTFYVKDSKECFITETVILTQPTALVASATATAFSCSATNTKQSATITIAVPTTGTAPYQYSFNGGGYSAANTLTLNDNGLDQPYTYSVRDSKGCIASGSGTLLKLDSPTDLSFTAAPITCTATTTTVTATAANGVGALTYAITFPLAAATSNTTGIFAGLSPDTYIFKVTDANGCYYTESHIVNPVTPIAVIATKLTDVDCFGNTTGSISYNVSGFATTYSYSINSAAAITGQTAAVFTLPNLGAATYNVVFTDETTGCSTPTSIVINEPTVLAVSSASATHVNCNNDDSQITVTASGGTTNYTYAAVITGASAPTTYNNSNVVTVDTNSATNLIWDVYIKDAKGCIATTTVTVISDALPTIDTPAIQCYVGSPINITITGTSVGVPTYSIGSGYQSSPNFTINAAGTYTLSLKDASGCIATTTYIVDPQLTVLPSVTKELDCTISPAATITVTAAGGKSPYSYEVSTDGGSTYAAMGTNVYSTLVAGTFQFRVTDANNCITTATSTINPLVPITVTTTDVNPSCNGALDGSVQIIPSGGVGPYTYSSDGVAYVPGSLFSGLADGTYTFYIKDSKECFITETVILTQPTALLASATATAFSCSATNTKQSATITIAVPTTGTAPYQYSFNGGGYTNTNTLTLNDDGTDQIIPYSVKDANGCTDGGSVTLLKLDSPTDLSFTAAPITCTATTTTVTVTATNGVGALTYDITFPLAAATSNTTGIFAGLSPDTYIFKVTDANGCYYTESHIVNPVTPIAVIATKLTDVDCFGNTTGSISYNVSGFATTYSYSINSAAAITGQTAAVFTLPNLGAATYDVVFTDETTGCTAPTSIVINEPAAILSATIAQVNANCFTPTSQVTVTPAGGTASYTYAYKQDGVAPIATDYVASNIANLNPITNTNWDVWIKDANGCTIQLNVVITTDPVPAVTASATGQCLGVGSYTITATGSGGTGTLNYSINAGASYQAGNTFVVATAGSYTIRVKDANGCTADSAPVVVAPQLTLTAVLDKDITCKAPTDAQITLTPAGGSGTFTYESKEALGAYTPMASNVFTTSAAGSYTFRVTDTGTGCGALTTTAMVTTLPVNPVIDDTAIAGNVGVTQTATINCNGEDTAAIAIAIDDTKGLSPFVFNISRTAPTVFDYGTQTSGLSAGDYLITVTDAKGCTDTETITITEPISIVVTRTIQPITCDTSTGVSLGSITINSVSGGTPNYIYHVTGVNGYNKQFANQTGSSAVFDVVDFGFYQIIVTDANGCSWIEQNILVASPPNDLDITVTAPPADCSTAGSATVAVGTTSTNLTGVGPFHFAVYSGPGMIYAGPTALPWYDEDAFGSKKVTIPNLLAGVTYTFIIHDQGTGCYYFETSSLAIPTQSTLTTSNVVAQNISCKGVGDGKVSFDITSTYPVTTSVTYEIYNSQSLASTLITGSGTVPANGTLPISNLGPLPFGNYFVLIRETGTATNAGCSVVTAPFDITESAIDLSVTATKIKNVNCNPNSGIIAAQAKDGTAPYTYQYLLDTDPVPTAASGWMPNTTFATSVTGNYIVYVKDDYGCIKQDAVTLAADDAPTIAPPLAPICYDGSTPFTITITGTVDPDIVGGATYSVNGSAFQPSPSFTFNAAGIYNLVIKDGNGCTANVDYEVYPKLNLAAALTKELDCTAIPNAEITLTTTGGNTTPAPNYTYEVSTNGGGSWTAMATNVYSAAIDGTYDFRVTDANNLTLCQATAIFDLDPIVPTVFPLPTPTDVSCFGGTDGTITVDVTSGVGPYEYQLDAGTFQTSNVFTGLAAGTTYVITVKDAKSCLYPSAPITITEPVVLTATSAITTPLTCGAGNAAQPATVTVNGVDGTAPYVYSFDGGTNYSSANTYQSYVGITFNVLVKDANGCLYTLVNGVNIPALVPPTDLDFVSTAVTCLALTSDVTLTTTNGVGTLSYEILSPASATSNVTGASSGIFTGLSPDTYLFQVTDANFCTYQESYTVDPVTNITVSGQLISDVTCNPGSNGEVLFTVGNFAGTYSYTINGALAVIGQSSPTITVSGLTTASTQTIIVTDETTGCTATTFIDVAQPAALTLVANPFINANCNFDAQVSVTASGGVAPYGYSYVISGAPAGTYSASASAVLDPAMATLWDVYVKDANNCVITTPLPITIATDALPIIVMPASQCFVGVPLTIDLSIGETVAVGPATYAINGSNQTSPIYTINAPGTYQLSIVDANGCSSNVVDYIVQPQLLLNAALTKELDCTTNPDAVVTLTAGGGTTSYTLYEYSTNAGASYTAMGSNVLTTLTPGNYIFRVTDTQGCQAVSSEVTVTPQTTPTFTLTQTNVSCNGGSDGSVVITAANGIAPYQYSIDNGVTYQASNVFTGLNAAGTYTVVVKDSKSCASATSPLTITEPTIVGGTALLTQGLTCGAGNATQAALVTVTGSGGTGSYAYSFDGGVNYTSTNTYSTNIAGMVTSYIKDANGCISAVPATVNVPALNPPTDLDFVSTAVTCLALTSDVTLTTTNGVGTLSYEILSPASATSNVTGASSGIFTGLSPDTYLFQVTDANFCTYQESYTVDPVTNITVSGQLVSDVTCNPGSNGEVLFTVGNFAGTYSYTINGALAVIGQSSPTITVSGLTTASTQTIIVTDETTGCTATTFIDVAQPAALTLVANPFINANCNFDAQVSVTASGGVAPYSYSYVISGAPAGTYSSSASAVLDPAMATSWDVYVKDANNCVITTPLPITIATDALPIIVMPASQCFVGVPLTIDLSIGETVAVGPATYAINGSNQTSPIYTINAPGTYQLSIVDANGCSSNVVDYIVQPQLLLNAALTKELDCTTNPDAVVTLTAGGGTTSYTLYEYSTNAGASYTAMGSNVLTTLTAGSYIFRVTDTQGCQAVSSEVTVTPQTTPTFTFTQTNVSCNGGSDGSIVITAANGIAPYQYSIDNGLTYQTSNVFTGLNAAGTYTVVVKDSKSCASATSPLTITEPTIVGGTAALTQGLTCGAGNATQAALVTVTGSGGTGSYEYSFDGGVNYTSTNTYSTNIAGMVTSYIKDANGCISAVPATVNVPALNPPTDLDFVSTAVTCLALTSDVTLTTTNGVGTLSYEILSPASATSNVTGASSGIFTGLSPDTYLFQVTDANFCTYQESYTVDPVTNITVSGQLVSDVTCNPGSNGEVLFTVGNFAGTYSYTINGALAVIGQSSPTITVSGLTTASTQTIIVTDETTGCTATTFIDVAQPAALTLVANPFINANCNFDAQVSVTASGGVAPYSYSYVISGAPAGTYSTSASAVLDPAMATSWDVYVKDANNCVITTPLTITIATDPLPSGITVSGLSQCPSATGDYTFTVNVATGIAPYEFSIGSGFQTSPTFTVNAPGTYDVIVKDANGCSTTATGLVVILPALQLQADITALPTCADGDGTLMLLATGGSGNYEYSIDSGVPQASANFTNIFAGTHTLTVRDITTNCTKSIPVTFGAATPITGFVLSKTDVTCNGGNDGTITAIMNTPAVGVNDNPIYTYSIDGGATTQTSTIFSGLIAGTYTIDVTSGRGCTATQIMMVNEPNLITIPAPTVVQFGCNSGSNAMNFATITVTGVTGGSGVYTNYEFLKGGTRVQFGASNVYTEANLLGGTYTVNVYDDKGCLGATTAPIVINPFIALDKINSVVNNAITCTNLEDITVSVSSIGGTPTNLQYTVADSNATTGVIGTNYNFTNTTGVFTGLNIGNYLITVENLDTGCSIQDVHYVNNPNTFDLTIDNIVDVTCFGGTDGSANVTIIDRTITATNPDQAGPFNYTIIDALGNPVTSGTTTNAGPITINALAAGTYSITATLTNSPYCGATKNFTVNQPTSALTLSETHTDITCVAGNNDGSIAASAVGGWPGAYEFQLELGAAVVAPWSPVANFTGLTQGTYTVRARDARGCSVFVDVLLSNPTPIVFTATPSTTLVSCFGDKNASITVSLPTGGQGSNYLYTLNTTSMVPATASGPQVSPTFSGLGVGTYTVTVTDGYSCSATSAPIVITEPSVVTASLVVATTQTCNNQTTLTLRAVGGTPPYTYSADGIIYNAASFNPSTTFPVAVGTHHYYVKDANGCTSYVSNDIKIDPLPALVINLDLSNAVVNCAGDATGVIVATAEGGLGNYVYTLQDASGNPLLAAVQSSPGVFTQLVAGGYKVQVSSLDCSATSALITVTEPSTPLTATFDATDATCNGANNGTIVINASGGTGIIKYAISPRLDQFFVSNVFELLQPGFYEIIAQDQNGCYIHTLGIEIQEPTLIIPSVDPLTIIPEMCFGDNDGAFIVDITGGTMPYSVSLDNINGPFTSGTATQTQFDFTGLAGGNHIVYIRDANLCNAEIEVPLPESVKLDPNAIIDYGCLNNSPSLTVTVTIDSSITNPADVDYALDGSGSYQSSNVFTNLSPGIHYITARHTNGCEKDTPDFEILQIDPLTLVLTDGGLNEIVATATGGGGGYQYTLNGEDMGSQNKFIYYKSGDYTVTVTDANGCVAIATRYFEFVDIKIPNVFTPNGDGDNDGWTPTNTMNYPDLVFHIFDRYGRKVGTYREGQFWDGKYNGKELPTGDYWYVLKLRNEQDSREFVGHFTLYR